MAASPGSYLPARMYPPAVTAVRKAELVRQEAGPRLRSPGLSGCRDAFGPDPSLVDTHCHVAADIVEFQAVRSVDIAGVLGVSHHRFRPPPCWAKLRALLRSRIDP